MIVVIDLGMGNMGSVLNMLRRVGADAVSSSKSVDIEKADKLILPGIGAFDNGMKKLGDFGILPTLREKVIEKRTPLLGICLGMQLLSRSSEEGTKPGLGYINAETVKFKFEHPDTQLKIPHMGWNTIKIKKKSALFDDMFETPKFYFVHSYHVACEDPSDILSLTYHGYEFTSAVERGNIFGVQFHPEKSHKYGMRLLQNFAGL